MRTLGMVSELASLEWTASGTCASLGFFDELGTEVSPLVFLSFSTVVFVVSSAADSAAVISAAAFRVVSFEAAFSMAPLSTTDSAVTFPVAVSSAAFCAIAVSFAALSAIDLSVSAL